MGLARARPNLQGALPLIDHISIAVRDLEKSARFYEAVLGRIGYAKLEVRPTTVGVSANIIDASFQALMDSIVYKLVKSGAPA